jgi:hypothetical protein
LFQRATLKT